MNYERHRVLIKLLIYLAITHNNVHDVFSSEHQYG